MNERDGTQISIERRINATPARLFRAWIEPEQLMQWWGPEGVTCPEAVVDLRVGGKYRIANKLPDGNTVWIHGEFIEITNPDRLVYSWNIGPDETESPDASIVTVSFIRDGNATIVRIKHERIANEDVAREHEHGWHGCLDGLAELVESQPNPL